MYPKFYILHSQSQAKSFCTSKHEWALFISITKLLMACVNLQGDGWFAFNISAVVRM